MDGILHSDIPVAGVSMKIKKLAIFFKCTYRGMWKSTMRRFLICICFLLWKRKSCVHASMKSNNGNDPFKINFQVCKIKILSEFEKYY